MQDLINTDIYWGEFSEADMDAVLSFCADKKFDQAKKYLENLGRTDFVFGAARSDFLYLSDVGKSSVCLDVGCGLGVHTFNMAGMAKEVHACDLSKKRVEFCQYRKETEKTENVFLYHSDIEHLPFEKEKFDFIVLNGVVEWLGEQNKNKNPRTDQIENLKKIYSLLKIGGTLYIGIENRFAAAYLRKAKDHNRLKYTTFMPRFLADFVTRKKTGKPYRTYTYGISGYKKLLAASGFGTKNLSFYAAHPGYNMPQYLIDFSDTGAFRFFFLGSNLGGFWKWILKRKTVVKIARHFFYSYAIFAKK
jgi:SAM-dependent methyltransferase